MADTSPRTRTCRSVVRAGTCSAALAAGFLLVTVAGVPSTAGAPVASSATPTAQATSATATAPGPFGCRFDATIDAIVGADGTAAAMGWAGNHEGVVACLGGSFYVQDGIDRSYGFGVYTGQRTSWADLDGYLPALVTSFTTDGADVSITEFADRVVLADHAFVLLYCRVSVHDDTDHPVSVAPDPTPGLVPLQSAPTTVDPHRTVDHDYVVAADRFGGSYPWPTAAAIVAAGGFDRHLAHMQSFWNGQLAQITSISVPDPRLGDAYRSGFIDTQIARSGDDLDTGVNGYASEFSHDVIGILANLFTQGDFADAHAILDEARSVVGSQGQYEDGLWTYPWPWAIYLLKTGDVSFVRANFAAEGPAGVSEPSIEDAAHTIAQDRTGPGGVMEATDDIDTDGLWTVDDYEALTGLAAYRYIAARLGDESQASWAQSEYDSLLGALNNALDTTISRYHLDYLPCSVVEPNSANRCANPEDANWAAPFLLGRWAWDGQLFGATIDGPGATLIAATYAYGFGRLRGILPAGTFGGYPDDYYSTGYDAGYGSWGLATASDRDQGIVGYEFMIDHTQSGPLSWWESDAAPSTDTPWVGSHPTAGQGSSPHAWGMANANKVLLDSLVAQRSDGALLVGRGIPAAWLVSSRSVSVSNFPTTDGRRLGIRITWRQRRVVTLAVTAGRPSGPVLFELPSFIANIATTSAGRVLEDAGTVEVPAAVRTVTVHLRHAVTASAAAISAAGG